ncbi:MAG: RNA polymerase sigma factor [Planctomycetota bacterium]
MSPESTDPRTGILKQAFRYRDGLISVAYSHLRDWAAAEDVVQESFLTVSGRWDQFQPGTNLFAWVRQIVRFKAMEAVRARKRRVSHEEKRLQEIAPKVVEEWMSEDRAEEQVRVRRALHSCMSGLEERSVDMIAEYYWKGVSTADIASRYERSENAVRLILSRLRARLRECMQRKLTEARA